MTKVFWDTTEDDACVTIFKEQRFLIGNTELRIGTRSYLFL